ncbi:hypothetical protein ACFP1I_12105 [Dyadobacter subterraneus]|uniref:O-antigen ligase domain-containing protein n=1 Tax=Dyadobacter subterraneus TaxID=2773304 RepID=A0ABR9WM82_9BACT|nr:hypothetical protein [Dyadobacter subterraneus]MBE9466619.1 hypothetical protein [Dyadobacter subterraneus]
MLFQNRVPFKKNKAGYILTGLMIIYAGGATTFVRSLETWEELLGLLLPVTVALFCLINKRIRLSSNFYKFLILFSVYFIITSIIFDSLHPRFFSIYVTSFLIAYVIINLLGEKFLLVYQNILYFLCITSIIFWLLHVLIPGPFISLLNAIPFSKPATDNVDVNILIYTINNEQLGSVTRNAGFAWEPGAFGCYVCLALYANLITNNFKVKGNLRFWVFLITILTTQSSTAYSILMIILLLYVYNQQTKLVIALAPFIIIIAAYFLSLPFMLKKVLDLSNQDFNELIANSIEYESRYAPQRITSFQIDFIDFLNNPIFGYGGHTEERWTEKAGANIATISGIGKILARFGLVGFIFFIYNLTWTSIYLTKIFKFRGRLLEVLIFIFIAISYSIIEQPILLCFWLLPFLKYSKSKIGKAGAINRRLAI